MRTTVRLDEDLMAEVRRLARSRGETFTSVLDRALRELLVRQTQSPSCKAVSIPTFRGNGLQPGVDLDDTADLLDLMDRFDGAD